MPLVESMWLGKQAAWTANGSYPDVTLQFFIYFKSIFEALALYEVPSM